MAPICYYITCLVLFVVSTTGTKARSDNKWNELILTQTWPRSFCTQTVIQKSHTCFIPKNVTTWNLHGIWPTESGSMGPNFCNNTDKFDISKLLPIRDKLLKYWANLFEDEETDGFWAHEWTKHGTCAETLTTLSTELKYFSAGLKLNRQFDLLKILAQGGVVPSMTVVYNVSQFVDQLKNALGVMPKLSCFTDQSTPRVQYIIQIEICLDCKLQQIECAHKPTKDWPQHIDLTPHQRLKRSTKHAQNEPCNKKLPIHYQVI